MHDLFFFVHSISTEGGETHGKQLKQLSCTWRTTSS